MEFFIEEEANWYAILCRQAVSPSGCLSTDVVSIGDDSNKPQDSISTVTTAVEDGIPESENYSSSSTSRNDEFPGLQNASYSEPLSNHDYAESHGSTTDQHMSPGVRNLSLSPSNSQHWATSPLSVSVPPLRPPYPTDDICDRTMLKRILNDYLEDIYPMIPVVHRPSFRQDLARGRDVYNRDFLGVVIGLCAVTIGIMPTRFEEYRAAENPIRFSTRTEMVNYCYQRLIELRGHNYFDEINLQKWAASYLMSIASFQVGQQNRARMIDVEHTQLARLLGIHQISSYDGLNCIETQLRKKAFWLMWYIYV